MPFGFVSSRIDLLPGQPAPEPIRLVTLIQLRWVAIAGQLAAVCAALVIGAEFALGPVLVAIIFAGMLNLTLMLRAARRISAHEAAWQLGFDLTQVATLLALTGGLVNPFALLLLVPVTIAATALPWVQMVVLAVATVVMVTLTAVFTQPLTFAAYAPLHLQHPLLVGHWFAIVIGAAFFTAFARRVATEISASSDALFAARMALEREQRLQHLGGVVAAAAHELGTPLATIKLVSAEMIDELDSQPELQEDARLIRAQADRCRDILRDMGRAGKDDLHLRQAPLSAVLREAAEPHLSRGKRVEFILLPEGRTQPTILRRPEIIHGLRNLIQNAVDFARSTVWIEVDWSDSTVTLRIIDDGEGFPQNVIGRIGDPFVRARRAEPEAPQRPGYEGMGLGLFIAKTLLERSGAELTFANATDPFLPYEDRPARCGAVVEAVWPLAKLLAPAVGALGENQRIEG